MNFALGNAQHIGARTQQQDAFGFSDPTNAGFVSHGGFAAVLADGMGGMAHGDAASRTGIKTFLAGYAAKRPEESIPDALLRSLLEANQAVYQTAHQLGAAEGMGTTLVCAAMHEGALYWVAAGDSAIFLCREGEFTQLNTPHIYAVELASKAAAGSITRESALANPDRESLTSYLGMAQLAAIDRNIRPFALEDADCVLLASDGLFKTLDETEMRSGMLGTFQERCDRLVRSVLEKQREGQDNVTVVALGASEGVEAAAFRPDPPVVRPKSQRTTPLKLVVVLALLMLAIALGTVVYYRYIARGPVAALPHHEGVPKPASGAAYDASKALPDGKFEHEPEPTAEPGNTDAPKPAAKDDKK
jgi:serine/threonine protein phosphatase PrpC